MPRTRSMLILCLLSVTTLMIAEQVTARAPAFRGTGYWSHNVAWARPSNNLDELASIEGALVRKFFVYVVLGKELSGERLIVPVETPRVSFSWPTGSIAWMPDVDVMKCDYDPNALGTLIRENVELAPASVRNRPKAEYSYERYLEGYQKLSGGRLLIIDGDRGPYYLLTPDGNPGSKEQIMIVQQDAFPDQGLDEICMED